MKEKIIYQNKKLREYGNPSGAATQGMAIGTDSTDHFNLICAECLRVMPVASITYYEETKQLYLFGVCTNCGMKSQRKIYLEQTEPKYLEAIVDKSVVILHNKERVRLSNPQSKEEFRVE